MLSSNDPGHTKRLKQTSYKLNIPEEVIELALHYMSEYIKNKIASVDIDHEVLLTKEEFESRFPIIKLPSLGYFKPNYYIYLHVYEKSKQKREREALLNNK